MPNKSLQQRLEEAKANSPVNDLTNHQQALRVTHGSRNVNGIVESKKVKVTTPWGTFNSITEARIAGGISEDTLRRRINKGMEGYAREGDHNNVKYSKPIQTPFGKFSSKTEAGKFAEKNNIMTNAVKKIDKFLKTDLENYYYIGDSNDK